jgi:hypothetical protein
VVEVALDAGVVVPLEAVHAEGGTLETLARGVSSASSGWLQSTTSTPLVRKHQAPIEAQHAGGLRNSPVGVALDGRAMFSDRQVEARIGERRRLGILEMEGKRDPEMLLHPTGRLELLW